MTAQELIDIVSKAKPDAYVNFRPAGGYGADDVYIDEHGQVNIEVGGADWAESE